MENKDVPYIVYEGAMASFERHIKRLIIALIICIILLFGSNAMWLWEWTQYDYIDEVETTTSYEQDGDLNIIGDMNDVTESNNDNTP